MRWALSHRYDTQAVPLADRHYNRRTIGAPQFVPPGRNVVLLTPTASALWVTSWPLAEYTRHAWPGAWVCSLFRNEGAGLSSELILEAVAASRAVLGPPPDVGIITFVDPYRTRRKRDPGRCFRRAGWTVIGETPIRRRTRDGRVRGGLVVLGQTPSAMPEPELPIGAQLAL